MPRTATQLQQVRDERRLALLDGAPKVFVRKGYTNARMVDIALESGASYGLLYHYFPTKEAPRRVRIAGTLPLSGAPQASVVFTALAA